MHQWSYLFLRHYGFFVKAVKVKVTKLVWNDCQTVMGDDARIETGSSSIQHLQTSLDTSLDNDKRMFPHFRQY